MRNKKTGGPYLQDRPSVHKRTARPRIDEPSYEPFGSLNAINSAGTPLPLIDKTMYCRPFSMYVIGDPVWGAGMNTAPASLPVALSYARSIAPRWPFGSITKPPSP